MELQINRPKRLISLVLGAALVLTGTVGLPANADAQSDAVTKISTYADGGSVDTPTDADYNAATGETTANSTNKDRINAYVVTLAAGDVNSPSEIRTVVDYVVARIKISEYDGGNNGRPGTGDFNDASIDNADALDIAAVRDLLTTYPSGERYSEADIQAIVDLANQATAVDIISNYDTGDLALTVELFAFAMVEGVTEDNLEAMLAVFALATRTQSNTVDEIQDLVDAQLAKDAAIELIANYNGRNDEPVLNDYRDAGVIGVTASNLEAINALFEDITYTNSNTLEEIQAVVDAELARVAALARIAAFAGVANAPVLQTYIDAGVLRVDANNFQAINVLLAGINSANSDTLVEIQDIVDDQATAQLVLTNYTGAGTALTVAQYGAAGISGVTAANLSQVNIALAAATVEGSNTAVEIQAIVDGLNATAAYWTKRVSATQAKLYAKNIVGAGKVQFFLNGREIAWVNATDAADPKLRSANGSYYLVRTVSLAAGKNVLEIRAKGERERRVVYSR